MVESRFRATDLRTRNALSENGSRPLRVSISSILASTSSFARFDPLCFCPGDVRAMPERDLKKVR